MSLSYNKAKRVLIRVDFNVPINKGKITDLTRIKSSLPTINYFLKKGMAVVLMSHLGRPKNKENSLSLKTLITPLSNLLKQNILFSSDIIQNSFKNLNAGEVLLLENLRFYPGEVKNDLNFSKLLSTYGDIYVNDAFGVAHREHSSVSGILNFFQNETYKGFLLDKELSHLEQLKNNYKQPYTLIVGGSKIGSKIHMLEAFLNKANSILIGGGMAFPFIKYLGGEIGNSLCNDNELAVVEQFLKKSKNSTTKIILPIDVIATDNIESQQNILTTEAISIPKKYMGVDIGPQTVELFAKTIKKSNSVLWNGPMGVSEIDAFSVGTKRIANIIVEATQNGSYSLIGGGDTISAISQYEMQTAFSYVSTGGGAMLEFFKQKDLPTVGNLKSINKNRTLKL
ncbi:MAG: phosphoglycerate kinase [Polaribacter sp.]|nr:phosphoglycerate kinase [Polaribacter sp.]